MSLAAPGPSMLERARASVGVFLTLAGVVCGLTMLYLGMRAVMEIGGTCAEGGPFEIARPCPTGVPAIMLGGIWGGIVFLGLYVWQTSKHKVPSLALLAWPALFLSLGWNFLEFGLDPPGDGGLAWGWLVCAVVFALMGGLPLLAVAAPMLKGFVAGGGDPGVDTGRPLAATRTLVRDKVRRAPGSAATPHPNRSSPSSGSGLVDALERLVDLHRSGGLTDDEFEAAKQRLLTGGGS